MFALFSRILKLSGRYKGRIQGAFVCAFLESILSKMPIFLAFVILSGFAAGTLTGQTCLYVGIGLAAAVLVQMLVHYLSDSLQSAAGYLMFADKRMELQKAQEARHRKTDGSATAGATRPHERPATASTISKPSAEKMQEVKRSATSTTSKISEPVKTNVVKERPLSSGASDRKATQPTQTVHRQNVEKVVSQEIRQNYTKDRRTKVQQTQNIQKNQQTTEKTRNLVTKKGQKKK